MKILFFEKIVSWFKKRKKIEEPLESSLNTQEIPPEISGKAFEEKKPSKKRPTPGEHQKKPRTPPVPPPPKWDAAEFCVEPCEGKVRFHDLSLPEPILHAIFDLGFKYCTPIQAEILPEALNGRDITGQAQTGTGKSAAFLITILCQMLQRRPEVKPQKGHPRALVLAPTRELVIQITKDAEDLGKYLRSRTVAVFGGLGYESQKNALMNTFSDIVVATPGRLIDFMDKNILKLDKVEFLVIDEADRMLDMGFIPDIRKIVHSTPEKTKRQTMFFSATLNSEVDRYARQWTRDSLRVEVDPGQVASQNIEQIIYIVTVTEKFPLLYNVITQNNLSRVLIFTNRKDRAKNVADRLNALDSNSKLISGDVVQKKRLTALEDFRGGKIRVLVATDVAARGIHIDDISHVINYNFPQDPEHYIHRIGRTGRAGSQGISISFACEKDSFYIPAIESMLGCQLKCEYPDPELLKEPPPPTKKVQSTDNKGDELISQSSKKQHSRPDNRRFKSKPGGRRRNGPPRGKGRPSAKSQPSD